ncbi:MAG: mechanosensitive ion channel [Lentisphaeria bacterium]|nr:mechanosensitive ion channel [Lentisphaeria bacterium]
MDFLKAFWGEYRGVIVAAGEKLLLALLVVLLGFIVCRILKRVVKKAADRIQKLDKAVGNIFYTAIRICVWTVSLLIVLDILGIDTTSILTVLGAAGLTVGLAIKDSLSNIAAGLMLLVLRPYHSGDYVDCGNVSGSISEIGLFTTQLTTFDGLFVMVPNSVIFGSPIKNYSRNPRRRADISVGISYGDSLEKGLKVLSEMLENNPRILKDPAPEVLVTELADNSVNLTLRFWAETGNYWEVYWQIKSMLKPVIEGAGLSIPFPQRVITLASPVPFETGR